MKDLTHGPVLRHLVALSVPVAAGMLLQTLYYLVDLCFVAGLGDAARLEGNSREKAAS